MIGSKAKTFLGSNKLIVGFVVVIFTAIAGTAGVATALRDDRPPGSPDPTTKEECRDGGFADFGFKNQGQCISFVARLGHGIGYGGDRPRTPREPRTEQGSQEEQEPVN